MMHLLLTERYRQLHDRIVHLAANFLTLHVDWRESAMRPTEARALFAQIRLQVDTLLVKHGASARDFLDLAVITGALTRYGRNPGIALSWMLNELIAELLAEKRNSDRQEGKIFALAVSEPVAGSHRNSLTTQAERRGNEFVLSGEKKFVTNAPIADAFVVVAVSGRHEGKNDLSAFVVPADTAGITCTKPTPLTFLQPCSHGGIIFDNCVIPKDALFGKPGHGYEATAVRIRAQEDVLMMALLAGTMSALLDLLVFDDTSAIMHDSVCTGLGKLRVLCDAAWCLAYSGSALIKNSEVPAEALSLSVACRGLAEEFQTVWQSLLDNRSIKPTKHQLHLSADLVGLLSIAKNVASLRQKKFGAALIKGAI